MFATRIALCIHFTLYFWEQYIQYGKEKTNK